MKDAHNLRMHRIEIFGDFITTGREGGMKVFSDQDNKQTLPTMKKTVKSTRPKLKVIKSFWQ